MKKINVLCIIIGIICFLVAGYIVFDKVLVKDVNIKINEEQENNNINEYLAKVGSSLGWLIVKEGIDTQDDSGMYTPNYNYNYLEKNENKQLFTMEYILSYSDNLSKFLVFSGFDMSKIDESPYSDATIAYLDYDSFNSYYKRLFNKDFNIKNGKKGNTKYDDEYVYFDNRHPGSNGIYVSMIISDKVLYNKGEYVASINVTYSTRLADKLGVSSNKGIVTYTKNSVNDIILKSFMLEK